MRIVRRNDYTQQAAIAALAKQGKVRLCWNASRRVIQVKALRPILVKVSA